ncbi:MAG: aspartyl/glutamyl-tRNA amidotransferase subunit C [Clostridia bacterium]|nr:aspartyl/glutamyl-tRNA amidotransferase subunit C [Clostridia bacterium]
MKITERDVEKTAFFARLEFDETEKKKLAREFDSIVAFAGAVNDAAFPPADNAAAGAQAVRSPLRADIPARFDAIDAMLRAAPCVVDGCIAVPRVVKEETDDA